MSTPDRAAFAALVAVILLGFLTQVEWRSHPAEDAAMLMRYSKHVAAGHGIVWNVGDTPVDGATDFLFMLSVAGLDAMGLETTSAVRVLTSAAHVLTVGVAYFFARLFLSSGPFVSFLGAAFLAVGPGLKYIEAYFGTTFFTLLATILWCLSVLAATETRSRAVDLGFVACGFLTGLTRPEGVILFGFLLLAVLVRRRIHGSRRLLVLVLAIFGVAGIGFLLWRAHYFGQFLPNPYLKKGGGTLYWSSLLSSAVNILRMSLPFSIVHVSVGVATLVSIPAYLTAVRGIGRDPDEAARGEEYLRWMLFYLIPLFGFSAIWILLSDEMNYFGRFQYPVLPAMLLSSAPLARMFSRRHALEVSAAGLAPLTRVSLAVLAAAALLSYQHRKNEFQRNWRDGRFDVAVELARLNNGYTMAVTEAGLLPLFSGWKAMDTWGLNDRQIARRGFIDDELLAAKRPELIMFHALDSSLVPPSSSADDWTRMTRVLRRFAESNGYVLAACFGVSLYDTHYYYVRGDFEDSVTVVKLIRGVPYHWMGIESTNFADFRRDDP